MAAEFHTDPDLQCPICFDIPEGEIYQCKDGHTVCGQCYVMVPECPQCRLSFGNDKIRNRAMETLMDKLTFDCHNVKLGCTEKMKRSGLRQHMESCQFSVGTTRLCELLGYNCKFGMSPANVAKALVHFQFEHKFLILHSSVGNFQYNLSKSVDPSPKDVQWSPIILQVTANAKKGANFLMNTCVNKEDKSVSFGCVSLNEPESIKVKDFEAYFLIKSSTDQIPDLQWTTNPVELTHPDTLIKGLVFRIPMSLLKSYYMFNKTIRVIAGVRRKADKLEFDAISQSTDTHLVFSTPMTPTASGTLSFPTVMSTVVMMTGRFEMTSSEGFGDYLKAIGVGVVQRNLAQKAIPTIEIQESGGRYSIKTLTSTKVSEISFVLGEEFDDELGDGRKAKTVVTKDGNKLIRIQKFGGDQTQVTYEFGENDMKEILTAKRVTASRVFRRCK